jgi:hypothetical protein
MVDLAVYGQNKSLRLPNSPKWDTDAKTLV